MNYKKAFYSKLEDCYLGVKIKDFEEGNIAKSGFSNLLQIKEQYFNHIKAYLDSQIEGELQSHDIYNKLFTFFDSYLNESGTPFFNDTPAYKNIYAKIYTNSKDTSLFYKTQNLYYVKSDTLYQSLTLSDEQSYEVVFDASEYKQNADNTKNKIIFKFVNVEINDEGKAQILIKVSNQKDLFPNLNNVFKQNSNEFSEEFLKDLKQNTILKDSKIKINEEELKKIFRSYKKQSEIDFFIHKNATAFLREQFDLWMFGYLYKESAIQEWNPEIIAHLQRIKNIAYEVIKLIGDFENELKAVWLKPKFAKKTEYVFSVDKLNPNLMDSITNDKGFKSQIKEWQELNLVDEDFKKEDLLSDEKYKFLPLDTKHFTKETKYKILSSFENLESVLNGELIKADNFQALNSLMPKYQGKVDLIYIDPPYNTGSDGFIYADNFNHTSWLSMINNRLELSKELLNDKGSMFISIDDKEQARLKLVCDEVFGEENFVANFVWQGKYTTSNDAKYASNQNENIFCFSSNIDRFSFNLLARTESMDAAYKNPDNDPKGAWKATPLHAKSGSENNLYTITFPNGISWSAPKGRYPRYSKERLMEIYFENGLYFNKNGGIDKKTYLSEVKQGKTIGTFWSYQEAGSTHEGNEDLASILDKGVFENPKPEKLLKRICEIATKVDSKAEVFEMRNCGFQDKGEGSLVSLNDQDFGVESAICRLKTTPIVLDFFAGSGTTLAVAQKLGRKWLGVEMGEHFYNVIIPRLKKVIAGFQSGISKECAYQGGGAFRYYELESYEEALSHCEYVLECKEPQKVENKNNYKGKDYAKCEAILDYRKSRKLIDKLHKGESVCLDMHTEYRQDFDIFQTIANLMGWKIKRLFLDSKGIESCEFDNGEIVSLDSLDLAKYPKLKNLIWWE
ncbi:site-specific DNA-methyltransferase [Helicobacter ganmani]|uniref:Site-specific DNA-methyltransferase n=2 Tax=Helicobacter ganmani TaxID=60246 RepID=A0A3D8IF09_9HELI|nr:site-specific DNA-methyltransferase [Helicobacter ganmani]RDU63807.1 site-specific DNA-methyltransferase [Helicobacter ganmani]